MSHRVGWATCMHQWSPYFILHVQFLCFFETRNRIMVKLAKVRHKIFIFTLVRAFVTGSCVYAWGLYWNVNLLRRSEWRKNGTGAKCQFRVLWSCTLFRKSLHECGWRKSLVLMLKRMSLPIISNHTQRFFSTQIWSAMFVPCCCQACKLLLASYSKWHACAFPTYAPSLWAIEPVDTQFSNFWLNGDLKQNMKKPHCKH